LRARIILKKHRQASVLRFHPWVFSGAIQSETEHLTDGAFVDIISDAGEYLASGHFASGSIAVRICSFAPVADEKELVETLIRRAYERRKTLGLTGRSETNAYRLFNAEGDGMPGLVIDWYNSVVVIQCHSAGVRRMRDVIVESLLRLYLGCVSAVIDRSPLDFQENETRESAPLGQCLYGTVHIGEICENGLTFAVDCMSGQKTGFFLDQRENRRLLERYAANQTVLNAFCYTGGFTVYALRGGAAWVHSVDISQVSLELAHENATRNFPNAEAAFTAADCLEYLKNLDRSYTLIVLDPPAFVKHRGALKGGIKGYESINFHALRQMPAGGILFTFSCSQFVDRTLFRDTITKAALHAGRQVRILHELRQAPCHPVSLYHPEGEYLKGYVLVVEG